MHDHGELARHRHERALMTAFGRKAQAPRLHGAVLLRSRHHRVGGLIRRGSDLAVATSRDVPVMIDRRPGLLAFRRQPKMGADDLRFGKPRGVIDRCLEGQRRHWPNTRSAAEAPAQLVSADHLYEQCVQPLVLRPQRGSAAEHACGRAAEERIIGDQRSDTGLETRTLDPAPDHQSEHLERLTDLIFDVHQFALQRAAVGEK